jgi:hypothetical protein
MDSDRRRFMQMAGATAGSALLSACGSGTTPASADSDPSTPAPSQPSQPSQPTTPTPPTPTTLVGQLQAFFQQYASSTFAMPAAVTNPPTIQWAGAFGNPVATTLPNGQTFAITNTLIGGPLLSKYAAALPGNPTLSGYPCMAIIRSFTCKGQPQTVSSPTVLHFKTDAAVVELAGVVADGSPFGAGSTLIIDGQLVAPTVLASQIPNNGGWDANSIVIDFGSNAVRDIWIKTGLYPAYLKIGASDSLQAVDDSTMPQITVVGDSYQQKPSSNFTDGAIALEIGARLGTYMIAIDSIGGTGYWNSGGDLGNFNDRLPGHSTDDSDIYVILGGLNDNGDLTASGEVVWPTAAAYEAGVNAYMQGLRAAQPNALIVVAAPFCPDPPMSDSSAVGVPSANNSGLGDWLFKAQTQKNAILQTAGPWIYIDVLMGGGWVNTSNQTGDITNLQWFTGGTPGAGTTATYKPGNTLGGGGGGFGGIVSVPVASGGQYSQAPNITASGGSGSGLLLASNIDATGALSSIDVVSPGVGYTDTGLPNITIDPSYQIAAATAGTPVLMVGINPNGEYPLPSFAPPGSSGELNNIYAMLMNDLVHPSPEGVNYLSTRLAQNIFEGVMAL